MFICIFFLTTHQILLFTIKTFFLKKNQFSLCLFTVITEKSITFSKLQETGLIFTS